jgi:adenylate kinase family enzyme
MQVTAMRIVVTGTPGAGTTTLARKIAAELALPHIELDAINWQPGWRALDQHDRGEFIRRVAAVRRASQTRQSGGMTNDSFVRA